MPPKKRSIDDEDSEHKSDKKTKVENNESVRLRTGRISIKPEIAERNRLAQRDEDREKQARELLQRKADQRSYQQSRIEGHVDTDNDRSELDQLAFELNSAYDWGGHEGQSVLVVARLNNGRYKVFAQRLLAPMRERAEKMHADKKFDFAPGGGSHLHAEMYALQYYFLEAKNPAEHIAEIGVSKRICPQCRAQLIRYGIVFNNGWTTEAISNNWIDPMRDLPQACKDKLTFLEKKKKPDDENDKKDKGVGGFVNPQMRSIKI